MTSYTNLPPSHLEYPRRQELVDLFGVVLDVSFQRKVPRVDKVQHEILHITSERLSAGLYEDDVIRSPESEHRHAARAEVLLPLGVKLRVSAVIVEQRKLRLCRALAGEQRRVEGVRLWRDARQERLGHAVRVLPLRRPELQEREERLSLGRARRERRGGPVRLERCPEVFAEALYVRVAVLGDDRGHAIGLSHSDAKCRRGLPVHVVGCVSFGVSMWGGRLRARGKRGCRIDAWNMEIGKKKRKKRRGTHAVVEDVDCELFHAERIEERLGREG